MRTDQLVAQARLDSPVGVLTLAATDHGLAYLLFEEEAHYSTSFDLPLKPGNKFIAAAARQLERYWRGPVRFDVELDPQGTPFQRTVWKALLDVKPGETSTYGEIARRIGMPHASRAVGAAIGRNPIAIIVPCHRIIGSDGSLTGYAGGMPRKEFLLQHEGVLLV